MQSIIRNQKYRSLHPVFDEMDRFYSMTSEKTVQVKNALIKPTFDNAFRYLHRLFRDYGDCKYDVNFTDKKYKAIQLPKQNNKNIILACSGGKDSAAAILHYRSRGYTVYLFHVLGINKSYPDEYKSVQAIAEYLSVPVHLEKIQFEGKLPFPEHPMKNMIIANAALHYGIANNIGTKIAFGSYSNVTLYNENLYTTGDDSAEMWMAYEDIVRKAIPRFRIYLGLQNLHHTYRWLEGDKTLLALCRSCIGAHRFRQFNHDNNEKKFGIKLMPNRCGSCWKCAAEYIYMADHDVLEFNEQYYKHCIKVLMKWLQKENGITYEYDSDLWLGFFKYSAQKSKLESIRIEDKAINGVA